LGGEGGEAGGDSTQAFLGEAAGVVLLLRHASRTLLQQAEKEQFGLQHGRPAKSTGVEGLVLLATGGQTTAANLVHFPLAPQPPHSLFCAGHAVQR
jgi:hypothetical protein